MTDQDKPEEKKKLVYAALEDAKAAVALDPHNFACHKWVGITLSDVGDFEGTKVGCRQKNGGLGARRRSMADLWRTTALTASAG